MKLSKDEMHERTRQDYPRLFEPSKTLLKKLAKANQMRQNKEARLQVRALIAKRREIDGWTMQRIADEIGVSRQRIEQILKTMGK